LQALSAAGGYVSSPYPGEDEFHGEDAGKVQELSLPKPDLRGLNGWPNNREIRLSANTGNLISGEFLSKSTTQEASSTYSFYSYYPPYMLNFHFRHKKAIPALL